MENEIKIIENNIHVDINELKKIIIDDWKNFYEYYYTKGYRGENLYKIVLGEIADYANGLSYRIEGSAQELLGRPAAKLDWSDLYPKSDIRSIGFEVLNFLESVWGVPRETLTTDDIPAILEFLDTPADKSLQAWDTWEKYWANLDYAERRIKLLENIED
jgi:hypothetical protein